jgi:adenine-specific DNA methylase
VNTETNETQPEAKIVQADSRNLEFLEDSSIDLVLTDPPYFDNFAYSELSDFFLPWLQLLKIIPHSDRTDWGINRNLAAKSRDTEALEEFQNALRECFFEIARVLKINGRLIFTYQHHTPGAWYALAKAIVDTSLQPIQLIPLLGDSSQGPGKGKGNIRWDAVFVFIKSTKMRPRRTLSVADETLKASEEHYLNWARELADLSKIKFRVADRCNFYRACLVAGTLGMFDSATTSSCSQRMSLEALLDASPPQR